MEEREEIEKYLKEYIESLNRNYPCFVEYLNYINELSFYVNYLGENIINVDYIDRIYLEKNLSSDDMYELCLEILQTLGYENEFKYMYQNKIIKYKKERKNTNSYTKVKHDKLLINVYKNNTIEDVLKTIHEFFHYIHISKYEKNLKNDKCFLFTETFAAIGELYTILYLYNNNLYKEDVVTYFKAYFNTLHIKANHTLLNGILIDIYDKHHSLDDEIIEKYIIEENHDDWVKKIIEYNSELESFDFFEDAGYALALIPALLTAVSMQENNDAILNVRDCIENIHEYNTMEKLYKKLNVYDVVYNQDNLIKLISQMYYFIKNVFDNNEINYQKKLGGL